MAVILGVRVKVPLVAKFVDLNWPLRWTSQQLQMINHPSIEEAIDAMPEGDIAYETGSPTFPRGQRFITVQIEPSSFFMGCLKYKGR